MDTSLWLLVAIFSVLVSEVRLYTVSQTITIAEAITCWTCGNMTSNDACNDWAPDRLCPEEHTVCQSIHVIKMSTGSSVLVTKRCARAVECSSQEVGCHIRDDGIKVCTSCCDFSYCNEAVPHSHESARDLSSLLNSAQSSSIHLCLLQWIISLLIVLLLR